MGKTKELLMDIEEKVWEALQIGASTNEDVLGYVRLFIPNADLENVQDAIRTVYAQRMGQDPRESS